MNMMVLISTSPSHTNNNLKIAYLASLSQPVIHFYLSIHSQQLVEIPDLTEIADFIVKHPTHIPLDEVFSHAEKLNGSAFKPFEFVGSPSSSVIVALGGVLAPETLVGHHSGAAHSTIVVNMFNPWKETEFLNLLPSNTESILLVEDETMASTWDPLYLAIVKSIVGSGIAHQPKVSFLDYQPTDPKLTKREVNEHIPETDEKYFSSLLQSIFGNDLNLYSAPKLGGAELALGMVIFFV
jgi:pyruvate/2-oxoacid:ferredoxin oxidoreductase alpha subunit